MAQNHRTLSILCECPMCVNTSTVMVEPKDYTNWVNGELAQNAFPYLNASEREQLISGTCSTCWDKLWADPQETGDDFEGDGQEDWEGESEDDGQPTEYEEWQDFMGGDDWDHGQYDEMPFTD